MLAISHILLFCIDNFSILMFSFTQCPNKVMNGFSDIDKVPCYSCASGIFLPLYHLFMVFLKLINLWFLPMILIQRYFCRFSVIKKCAHKIDLQWNKLIIFLFFPFKKCRFTFSKEKNKREINTSIFTNTFFCQPCFIFNQHFPLAK